MITGGPGTMSYTEKTFQLEHNLFDLHIDQNHESEGNA